MHVSAFRGTRFNTFIAGIFHRGNAMTGSETQFVDEVGEWRRWDAITGCDSLARPGHAMQATCALGATRRAPYPYAAHGLAEVMMVLIDRAQIPCRRRGVQAIFPPSTAGSMELSSTLSEAAYRACPRPCSYTGRLHLCITIQGDV